MERIKDDVVDGAPSGLLRTGNSDKGALVRKIFRILASPFEAVGADYGVSRRDGRKFHGARAGGGARREGLTRGLEPK